jgi:hypothetical protein
MKPGFQVAGTAAPFHTVAGAAALNCQPLVDLSAVAAVVVVVVVVVVDGCGARGSLPFRGDHDVQLGCINDKVCDACRAYTTFVSSAKSRKAPRVGEQSGEL